MGYKDHSSRRLPDEDTSVEVILADENQAGFFIQIEEDGPLTFFRRQDVSLELLDPDQENDEPAYAAITLSERLAINAGLL